MKKLTQLFIIATAILLSGHAVVHAGDSSYRTYSSDNPEDMERMKKDLESGNFFLPPGAEMHEGKTGQLEIHQTVVCDERTGKVNAPGLPDFIVQDLEKKCKRQSSWWGRIINQIEDFIKQ